MTLSTARRRAVALAVVAALALSLLGAPVGAQGPPLGPAELAPSGLEVSLVANRVTLAWQAPASDAASVTGYEILRRRPKQGERALAALVADTESADTAYTDHSADEAGVRYTYRVKALRGGDKSRWSNFARIDLPADYDPHSTPDTDDHSGGATTGDAQPAPAYCDETDTAWQEADLTPGIAHVETLVLSNVTHDSVTLEWTAPAGDAPLGYVIVRRNNGGTYEIAHCTMDPSQTSHTDSGLEPETEYTYWVSAIRPTGVTLISRTATASATTMSLQAAAASQHVCAVSAGLGVGTAEVEPPGPPTNVQIALNGHFLFGYKVVVTWDPPADGGDVESYYVVISSSLPDGSEAGPELLGTTAGTHTVSYKAVSPRIYDAAVCGWNGSAAAPDGFGPAGAAEERVSVSTPGAPTELTASTTGDGAVELSWTAPSQASVTGYRIWRRTYDGSGTGLELLVEDTDSATTTYRDETIDPRLCHSYQVATVNAYDVGPRSSLVHSSAACGDVIDPAWLDTDTLTGGTAGTAQPGSGLRSALARGVIVRTDSENACVRLSDKTAGTATTDPPGQPMNPQIGLDSDGSHLEITWDPPSGGGDALEYHVVLFWRAPDGALNSGELLQPPAGSLAVSYAATDGYLYYAVVCGWNGSETGENGFGPESEMTERLLIAVPSTPTELSATLEQSGAVQLSWTGTPSVPVASHRILRERHEGNTTSGVAKFEMGGEPASYLDETAAAGACYSYRVQAVNVYGRSADSAEVEMPAGCVQQEMDEAAAAREAWLATEIDNPFVMLSGGYTRTCGLREDRTAVCWGGSWEHPSADHPTEKYIAIAAGGWKTLAIRESDRRILCWQTAQLVDHLCGAPASWSTTTHDFVSVMVRGWDLCAMTSAGAVDCTRNYGGRPLTNPEGPHVSMSRGPNHYCVVSADGTAECREDWYSYDPEYLFDATPIFTPPAEYQDNYCDPDDGCPSEMAATMTADGTVRLRWDLVEQGPHAFGPVAGYRITRRTHGALEVAPQVLVHNTGSAARTYFDATAAAGTCYSYRVRPLTAAGFPGPPSAWAWAPDGCAGSGGHGIHIIQVASNSMAACMLYVDSGVAYGPGDPGRIQCWTDETPKILDSPKGQFVEISGGGRHSCALRADGTIKCWGQNNFGQTKAPEGTFKALSQHWMGQEHSCAIRTNGEVACWGNDSTGEASPPHQRVEVDMHEDLPAERGPSDLVADRAGGRRVELSWNAPAQDADIVTGYRILRRAVSAPGECSGDRSACQAGKFTLVLVEDTRDQQTTYVDKDAVPGMLYRYWVQARRGSELSRASDRALTDD